MSFYIYILRCADGSYYTGHTDNLEAGIAAHNVGGIPGYSAARRPVELIYAEPMATRSEALERERQIKGWSREKKEALTKGDWARLQTLAKPRGSTGSPRTEEKEANIEGGHPRAHQGKKVEASLFPVRPELVEGRAGIFRRGYKLTGASITSNKGAQCPRSPSSSP